MIDGLGFKAFRVPWPVVCGCIQRIARITFRDRQLTLEDP